MKSNEDVRKFAAEQVIAEEVALKMGGGRKIPRVHRERQRALREGLRHASFRHA